MFGLLHNNEFCVITGPTLILGLLQFMGVQHVTEELEGKNTCRILVGKFGISRTKFWDKINMKYAERKEWSQYSVSNLCGLVIRVLSYTARGPGFNFRRY
jgi:hypothetical protein